MAKLISYFDLQLIQLRRSSTTQNGFILRTLHVVSLLGNVARRMFSYGFLSRFLRSVITPYSSITATGCSVGLTDQKVGTCMVLIWNFGSDPSFAWTQSAVYVESEVTALKLSNLTVLYQFCMSANEVYFTPSTCHPFNRRRYSL